MSLGHIILNYTSLESSRRQDLKNYDQKNEFSHLQLEESPEG